MSRSIDYYGLPASTCVGCRATEIWFRRKGIEANKIRLDQDADALAFVKSLGYQAAPVVVIRDGDQVVDHWGGFSEERITKLA